MKSTDELIVLLLEERSQDAVRVVVERMVCLVDVIFMSVLRQYLGNEEVLTLCKRVSNHLAKRGLRDRVNL